MPTFGHTVASHDPKTATLTNEPPILPQHAVLSLRDPDPDPALPSS